MRARAEELKRSLEQVSTALELYADRVLWCGLPINLPLLPSLLTMKSQHLQHPAACVVLYMLPWMFRQSLQPIPVVLLQVPHLLLSLLMSL